MPCWSTSPTDFGSMLCMSTMFNELHVGGCFSDVAVKRYPFRVTRASTDPALLCADFSRVMNIHSYLLSFLA